MLFQNITHRTPCTHSFACFLRLAHITASVLCNHKKCQVVLNGALYSVFCFFSRLLFIFAFLFKNAIQINRTRLVCVSFVFSRSNIYLYGKRRFVSFNSINIIFVSYVMIAALVLRGHSPKKNCLYDVCECGVRVCVCLCSLLYTDTRIVFTLMFKHLCEVTGAHTLTHLIQHKHTFPSHRD